MGVSEDLRVSGICRLRDRPIAIRGSVKDVVNGVRSTHVENKDAYRISVGKAGG
jgi:hypothetical protein